MSLEQAPVALLDVDVGRPLADVVVAPRYRHAWIVVMLRGAPVGVLSLELRDGRYPAAALAAVIHRRLGAALVRRLAGDAAECPSALAGGTAGAEGRVGALLRGPAAGGDLPAGGRPPIAPLSVAVCT
ncbi:MAG: hypothetical protein ACYC2G_17470, partial [Gemmatimonadaceae bacterium]